jgi:hypothetical protein
MAMAVTNIELYEELKKSLTEDAARMIAEVVPVTGEVATKSDIALLGAELKSYIDSRLLKYTATVVIPICTMMLGAVIAFVIKI